jgi:hypothetical protein
MQIEEQGDTITYLSKCLLLVNPNLSRIQRNWTTHSCWKKCKTVQPPWERVYIFFPKVIINLTVCNPETALLAIHPEK